MTVPYKGGRPKAFNSPEELQALLDEYFDYCDNNVETITDNKGNIKTIHKPYTMTGICVYLDISGETWSDYSKKPEFSETIKKARKKVENYCEENTMAGRLNPIFSIFSLKNNFGWVDKIEVNTTTSSDQLTNDDIQSKINELKKNRKGIDTSES